MSENSQDITIGNQQERLFLMVGYLLGIIDGEGSCQFGYKYLYKGCKIFSPKITIFNTNPTIIKITKDYLEKLGVPYYIYAPKIHGRERCQGWRVEIVGMKRVKKLTDILLQYTSGKKERLQVLNDFCNHRIKVGRIGYTDIDKNFFTTLTELNRLYRGIQETKSSETIRSDATA